MTTNVKPLLMTRPTSSLLIRSTRLAGGVLLLGSLLACGYKGPLYLPPPEDPPASLTEPPAPESHPRSTTN